MSSSGNHGNQSILPFPSEGPGLPDPLRAPDQAAAAVWRGCRGLAGLDEEAFATAIRQAPRQLHVTADAVRMYEAAVALSSAESLLVACAVAGRAVLTLLAQLPLRD